MFKYLVVCLALVGVVLPSQYWQGSAVLIDDNFELEVTEVPIEFGAVDGICSYSSQLYLADEGSRAVRIMEASGECRTLATAEDGIHSPENIVRAGDGNLYFTDDDVGGLWRLSVDGGKPENLASHLGSTEGLAVTTDGELIVGDALGRRLIAYKLENRTVRAIDVPGLRKPESIAAAPDGRLFVADDEGNAVLCIEADGVIHKVLGRRDGLKEPDAIAFHNGTLYVIDASTSRLLRFHEAEGLQCIAQFAGKLKNIQGIAVANSGDIYLSVQVDLQRNTGLLLRLSRKSTLQPSSRLNVQPL